MSLSDQAKVLDLGTQNGQRLFRLLGSPTAFNFQPVAEGEADSAMDAALAAITDRTDSGLLGSLASNDSLDQAATDAALTSMSDWH